MEHILIGQAYVSRSQELDSTSIDRSRHQVRSIPCAGKSSKSIYWFSLVKSGLILTWFEPNKHEMNSENSISNQSNLFFSSPWRTKGRRRWREKKFPNRCLNFFNLKFDFINHDFLNDLINIRQLNISKYSLPIFLELITLTRRICILLYVEHNKHVWNWFLLV